MFPHAISSFDPIELVRGVLSLLSHNGDIHSRRIQEILSNLGVISDDLVSSLRELRLLKEIEGLGYGYWVATPTRSVPINDHFSLLISIAPTYELKRHFPSIVRAGIGRVVPTSEVLSLPTQSMLSWRGLDGRSNADLTREFIEHNKENLKSSIMPLNLEAFSIKETSLKEHTVIQEPTWLSYNDSRVLSYAKVSLFRTKVTKKYYRYFLGEIDHNGNFLEGVSVLDYRGFQFGFSAILEKPLSVLVRRSGNAIAITLPLFPSDSLKQILTSLCKIDEDRYGFVWFCSNVECWELISSVFKKIGCEIINYG